MATLDKGQAAAPRCALMRFPPWWLAALLLIPTPSLKVSETGRGSPLAAAVERPPIVGIAHVELKSDNLNRAEEFYGHVLGFKVGRSFEIPLMRAPINDHQRIDVWASLKNPTEDRLAHIAFETTDVNRLRDYLASRGVSVVPTETSAVAEGLPNFAVKDPDGHVVQFVQYDYKALPERSLLPETRLSTRIIHTGITIKDRAAADRFYQDILGFRLMWQGGMTDDRTDWVDMRVPEGTDWLEYMLNVHKPSRHTLGVMHHLALGVPSAQAAYKTVTERGYKGEKPQIGRDGKWQLNLYDPDGTRVELMEPKPVRAPCCSPMRDP